VEGGRLVTSVKELLEDARRLDLSITKGRFRLGDLIETLGRELPAVANLHDRLAIDLELERNIITEAWLTAAAFPAATRCPGLPWASYVILRFHPARHELADCAEREGWDQARLERELSVWFVVHHGERTDH
jgi:hypothetical protein